MLIQQEMSQTVSKKIWTEINLTTELQCAVISMPKQKVFSNHINCSKTSGKAVPQLWASSRETSVTKVDMGQPEVQTDRN